MSFVFVYCLLTIGAFFSPIAACDPSVVPVNVVLDIQKCICDVEQTDADCCRAVSSQLDSLQSNGDSLIDVIVDVLTGISNLDTFISQYDILINRAEGIDVNLVKSLVKTIFSTGSSFENIFSRIDIDMLLDETIASQLSVTETNVITLSSLVDELAAQDCASTNDLIVSNLDQLSGAVQDLKLLFTQISQTDALIESELDDITTKIDNVQSVLDALAHEGCDSSQDIIVSMLGQLQDQEASCCQNLSLQLTDLRNDLDLHLTRIESISFIEQFLGIMSAVDIFEGAFESYIDTTQSGFDSITSQLDVLAGCASMPIIAPITITAPGNYCLDRDTSGDIVIASSDVSLNLNNRALSGSIIINAGLQNIVIKNGRLNGSGVNYGITVNGSSGNILVSNVYITNFLVGIVALGTIFFPVQNLYIDGVTVAQCSLVGYSIQETNGVMTSSVAFQNTDGGINVTATNSSFTIIDVQSINNGTYGFMVQGSGNFSALTAAIYDSLAYSNNNNSGFVFEECMMYVENCISQNNGVDGFFINNQSAESVQGLIFDCKALSNSRAGFNVLNSSTSVRFISNYSTGNGICSYGVNGVYQANNQFPYYWLSSNASSITSHNNASGV